MTESEWNSSRDPTSMLAFVNGRVSDRKLRLFGVACCRRIWRLLTHEASRKAVQTAELHADGLCESSLLEKVAGEAREVVQLLSRESEAHEYAGGAAAWCADWNRSGMSAGAAAVATQIACQERDPKHVIEEEDAWQSTILRCIIGPLLFRRLHISPGWITSEVKDLAAAIYTERAYERLATLANALEAAGCTDSDMIGHCRAKTDHVRGCWVVDLILSKDR